MSKHQAPLVLDKLSKYYGSDVGIKDVSFELRSGEVFGFLGPNGAGKSTAIRTVLGFLTPTTGTISLFGEKDLDKQVALRARVGYLSGDLAMYDKMTGRQFTKFLSRLGYKVNQNVVEELARSFDANLDRPIKTLSKGNRQKIGIIQAFMHEPDLLILDEPTTGLDPLMKEVFYETVRSAAARGATVFVSSHDLAEVQKICDRAGFIRGGELISIEDVAQAIKMSAHRYTATFASIPKSTWFDGVKGVKDVNITGKQLTAEVHGDVSGFIAELATHKPTNLREHELELEELFMGYYSNKEVESNV